MKKPDIAIGYRAVSEVKRLFPKRKHAVIAIGCGNDALKEWGCGVAPSAVQLARLCELGADVVWILTGRRTNHGT